MLVQLASASMVRMELDRLGWARLADTNRTSMANTYSLYTVLRYS